MCGKNLSPYKVGKSGEDAALGYLKKKKFRIVEKGFRLFRGEIDIIAYDGKVLVFIEVKTRRGSKYGFPEEAVTLSKQKQIKRIATGYLAFNRLEDIECRFDVLSLKMKHDRKYSITHYRDAF
jgi:putative endonuclease